jgi:ATP phosphoribosyltransferase regulatory subunit
MSSNGQKTWVPDGVRDRLATEASRMRELSGLLEDVYREWGYREVITPAFEFAETAAAGFGVSDPQELYQFFDRRGRTLALRPDMTTPIARLAATKLVSAPRPLRLSYWANVFRYDEGKTGGLHELWQSGVELIGSSGPSSDAEVVALASAAMDAVGLEGFKIGLGHVGFLEGLMKSCGCTPEEKSLLRQDLARRDYVSYEKRLEDWAFEETHRALLRSVTDFHGNLDTARKAFGGAESEEVERSLSNLEQILGLMNDYGVADRVVLDLGLVRTFGYYTGLVFEGYAPGLGNPVCGGGRYDRLLASLGPDEPAIGFALSIDGVLAAPERREAHPIDLTGSGGHAPPLARRPGKVLFAGIH